MYPPPQYTAPDLSDLRDTAVDYGLLYVYLLYFVCTDSWFSSRFLLLDAPCSTQGTNSPRFQTHKLVNLPECTCIYAVHFHRAC